MSQSTPSTQPLSQAQYGIWLGQQLDPHNPSYWTAEALNLVGALDQSALAQAVQAVIMACDSLHMRFASNGECQYLQRPAYWQLEQLDLSQQADPREAALALLASQREQAPDLQVGPLFRCQLLHLGKDQHLLALQVHHIAVDGYAYALLWRQIAQAYRTLCSDQALPELSFCMATVLGEDQHYQATQAASDRIFWQAKLACMPPPLTLAPPQPMSASVRVHSASLSASEFARWQAYASQAKVDWFALALAMIAIWQYRLTGSCAQTLGLPVMNRLGSVSLGLPCMHMNIVPLPIVIDPQASLLVLARSIGRLLREIRPHQRYRYEHLRRDLGRVGGSARLFGTVVNLLPFDHQFDFGEVSAQHHTLSAGPVEDLALNLAPATDGLHLSLQANPAAYSEEGLSQLHGQLQDTLSRLLAQPEQGLADLFEFTFPGLVGQPISQPDCLLACLQAVARARPQHPAIEQAGGQALSYAELIAAVQLLAGQLAARGVRPGQRVGLLLPRQNQTIVAVLAVLWLGATFVPLDPNGPSLRRAQLLAQAELSLVISEGEWLSQLAVASFDLAAPASHPPLSEPLAQLAEQAAYLMYTSGSSGQPKGVAVSRAALEHFLAASGERYQISPNDRVLQFAPLHFDASIEEIFLPLLNGATLVLRDDAMLEAMPRFLASLARLRISVLDLPTAFWHELAYILGEGQLSWPDSIRLVIIGGEAALAERLQRWRQAVPARVRLLNTYGPTEATVIISSAELSGPLAQAWTGDSPPIGTPLAGMTCAILDPAMQPVAPGAIGELWLIGAALANGYYGDPTQTATRFQTLACLPGNPRAYRSGDLARCVDGQLYYLGRLDDEFKLSGQRIDPAEVETALLSCGGVVESAVLGLTDQAGRKRLHAFIVGEGHSASSLRTALGERLPALAIPSRYDFVPSLPRNRNGKIDRKALREWALRDSEGPMAGPAASPLETQVMAVWRAVLGELPLQLSDDFFLLGGKSLQAIQVASRLGSLLQRDVPVSLLFRHPSVAELAQALGQLDASPPRDAQAAFAPLLHIQAGDGLPLFCIHPAEGLAWCYFGLARQLPGQALYGLQARGLSADAPPTWDAMLDDYLQQIRQVQAHGPYQLLGWSMGGAMAQALAVKLQALGEEVSLLALLDSYPTECWRDKPSPSRREALEALLDIGGQSTVDDHGQALDEAAILARLQEPNQALAGFSLSQIETLCRVTLHNMQQFRASHSAHFAGELSLFYATDRAPDAPQAAAWLSLCGQLTRIDITARHANMTQAAALAQLGGFLRERLQG